MRRLIVGLSLMVALCAVVVGTHVVDYGDGCYAAQLVPDLIFCEDSVYTADLSFILTK